MPIAYEKHNTRFSYRVAAVICDEQHVLLQGEPQGTFWTLPGGRVELLEPSQDALIREMQEELGVHISIERLLWVIEQFFMSNGKRHHELGLYYLVTPLNAPHLFDTSRTIRTIEDDGTPILFRWFMLNELLQEDGIKLYPTFLSEALWHLPLVPCHVVVKESL